MTPRLMDIVPGHALEAVQPWYDLLKDLLVMAACPRKRTTKVRSGTLPTKTRIMIGFTSATRLL